MTVADRITLARLVLAPLAVLGYLMVAPPWCFWACGVLCAIAETTDYLDGRVARARGEVSDFGKLADPFCDVLYRISIFLVFLLPAGGAGWPVAAPGLAPAEATRLGLETVRASDAADLGGWLLAPPVYVIGWDHGQPVLGAGLVPWLPVFLMVLREIVAGALRAMAATRGLVLAARDSGKVKAWLQGVTIITVMAFPALWFQRSPWHLAYAALATWVCALASVLSISEYLWVNRAILARLAQRRPAATP